MRKLLAAITVGLWLSASLAGQTGEFTKDSLDYVLDLPTSSWRAVQRLDGHEHVEFVNGADYVNGHLRMRKRFVTANTGPEGLFGYDEKWELRRLPGYVACNNGSGTDFGGYLKGKVFSYQFVSRGMNMDARIYYLRVNKRVFYALHFTVASTKLHGLRDQMDSIARSFRLK